MSRIEQSLTRLKAENRKALIPYITAGDPYPGVTVGLMHELVAAGADIIELGVPFSDPMADGPVIQKAVENALEHDVSLNDVLAMVEQFRAQDSDTPVVLMGYLNPVEQMGYAEFAQACKRVGVDGVLTVDLPPEEAADLTEQLVKQAVDRIFLLSPTSRPDRIKLIAKHASGYIYYVSLKGITGANTLDIASVAEKMAEIRAVTEIPVGVGFGIKNAELAASVAEVADAVVVGSALVSRLHNIYQARQALSDASLLEPALKEAVAELIHSMRTAMDAATSQS